MILTINISKQAPGTYVAQAMKAGQLATEPQIYDRIETAIMEGSHTSSSSPITACRLEHWKFKTRSSGQGNSQIGLWRSWPPSIGSWIYAATYEKAHR